MALFNKRRKTRLTRVGLSVLVIIALVLLAALNTGTNLLYAAFGGLMSFFLLAYFMAWAMLRRLSVKREAPRAVHRGDRFPITLRLENHNRFIPVTAIRIEQNHMSNEQIGWVSQIPSRRAAVLRTMDSFESRGVHRLPPLRIITGFPFGFMQSTLRTQDAVEVVVYPRIRAIKAVRIEQHGGSGDLARVTRRDGDEFFSLREYLPGDDPRRIAWRQSARRGNLVVKELEQETSRFMLFILETRRGTREITSNEDFEEAIELLASLAVTMLQRHYRVAVQTREHYIPEGEGKSHMISILDFLARVEAADEDSFTPFDFVAAIDRKRATYVFISGDPSQWGLHVAYGGARVLHPRDVIHA